MLESFSVDFGDIDAPSNLPLTANGVQIFDGGSTKLAFVETAFLDLFNPSLISKT